MKKRVTILFADIRDFSLLAEKLAPDKVVSHLNEFLSAMINVIFEGKGTLDKFLGDGLMVEFGAPLDDPEQEKHSVETAIAMQNALCRLNQDFEKRGLPTMEMVIAIHTGQAIMDHIGSAKRMEYTAIGDAVNVASRIEYAAKQYHAPILVTDATWKKISHLFKAEELAPVQIKGKSDPIKVYSVKFQTD